MLALAWTPILLVVLVGCEFVVSLDHFDDGANKDGGRGGSDSAADGRWAFLDGGSDARDDAPDSAMDAVDGDAGGVASDAAVDGLTDAAPDCPWQRGPTPVEIDTSRGSYCIDSTEINNVQYAQFLSAIVSANATRPPGCEGLVNFTPHGLWPYSPGTDQYPVVSVDWCQAYAYCAWAGKRLCGRMPRGPLAMGPAETDALQSQWFNACSAGGQNAYPYGNAFKQGVCSAPAGRQTLIQPVGTQLQCMGGYPGLFDMTGNVWEWADVCATTAANSLCRVYGGAFDSNPPELSCSFTGRESPRTGSANNIGIRCCADL
jgi:sulfatase modifying factor 1